MDTFRALLRFVVNHDDVIKWKHFPRYWPFVRGIPRSPANSPHKGQWRGGLMFSLIFVWINSWVNNRESGNLRQYRAHYDVTVMCSDRFHLYLSWCLHWYQSKLMIAPMSAKQFWRTCAKQSENSLNYDDIIIRKIWIFMGCTVESSCSGTNTIALQDGDFSYVTMYPQIQKKWKAASMYGRSLTPWGPVMHICVSVIISTGNRFSAVQRSWLIRLKKCTTCMGTWVCYLTIGNTHVSR